MLAAVGWTVLRLRLDARKGDHIGDRDVVVESSGFTRAAQSALVEAIEDFKEQRPGRVSIVPKGKSPRAAQRRSHIANIGPDRYSDDTYWFTWYPGLDSPESHRLRLAVGGRYLYCAAGRGSLFVDEVGLHEVARDDWKARLTAYLAGKTPADLRGATKWPWGDNLLIPHDPVDVLAAEIVAASDHEKQTIDRIDKDDYGFCDQCGVEIGIRRLEARPTATLCIDCKTLAEISAASIFTSKSPAVTACPRSTDIERMEPMTFGAS